MLRRNTKFAHLSAKNRTQDDAQKKVVANRQNYNFRIMLYIHNLTTELYLYQWSFLCVRILPSSETEQVKYGLA
jgi:hypothetical protein